MMVVALHGRHRERHEPFPDTASAHPVEEEVRHDLADITARPGRCRDAGTGESADRSILYEILGFTIVAAQQVPIPLECCAVKVHRIGRRSVPLGHGIISPQAAATVLSL